MPPDEFARRWESIPDEKTRADALRMRFRFDRAAFLRYCFPEMYELPWNEFHLAELGRDVPAWKDRKRKPNVRRAVAAPRGVAKTTLVKGEIVHDVVYDLERFVVVLSAEERLALSINAHIRSLFKQADSPLAKLYGPFKVTGQTEEFQVWVRDRKRPVAFLARSFGTQVRGANYNAQRPTKFVIDDGERPDRVRNPDQRKIWWEFLTQDILKAGPASGGALIEWRGTVLHNDSILARLLKQPGWASEKWKAIKAWPLRQDLWEQCHRIWADLANPMAVDDARAFYELNQEEMDRGVDVLDPVTRPIFACYEIIWSEGLASFLKELQNEPRDPSAALFDASRMAKCRVVGDRVIAADGREIPLSQLAIYAHLDPALGKDAGMPGDSGAGAGDYASLAVVGRDQHGYGYLLDVWMRRARPTEQLQAFWELHDRWHFTRFSIEVNGFQALMGRDFRRMQIERRDAGQSWQVPIDEDTSSTPKDERIASLEPAVANGWLQFNEALPREVIAQFEDFPGADHDDAPDSVEGAWRNSRNPSRGGGRIV